MVGRSLIRTGQIVFLIDTSSGNLRLIPAETHDVEGGPFPETWKYNLTLGGPTRTVAYDAVPATSVLHIRYAPSEAKPWVGNGPVQVAALAGKLSAATIAALADESSGPVGRLLGIPLGGDDVMVDGLKQDIANAKGKMALLETGDWGGASDARVAMKSERFGPEPPSSLVELVDVSSREDIRGLWLQRGLVGRLKCFCQGSMAAGPIQCLVTPRADGRVRTEGQT